MSAHLNAPHRSPFRARAQKRCYKTVQTGEHHALCHLRFPIVQLWQPHLPSIKFHTVVSYFGVLQFSTVINVLNQKNTRNRITYHTHYVVNVVEKAPEEQGLGPQLIFESVSSSTRMSVVAERWRPSTQIIEWIWVGWNKSKIIFVFFSNFSTGSFEGFLFWAEGSSLAFVRVAPLLLTTDGGQETAVVVTEWELRTIKATRMLGAQKCANPSLFRANALELLLLFRFWCQEITVQFTIILYNYNIF